MYYYNLINELSKIRKPPLSNMNDNNLSLIVAYRDPGDGSRRSQLNIFLEQSGYSFTLFKSLYDDNIEINEIIYEINI